MSVSFQNIHLIIKSLFVIQGAAKLLESDGEVFVASLLLVCSSGNVSTILVEVKLEITILKKSADGFPSKLILVP